MASTRALARLVDRRLAANGSQCLRNSFSLRNSCLQSTFSQSPLQTRRVSSTSQVGIPSQQPRRLFSSKPDDSSKDSCRLPLYSRVGIVSLLLLAVSAPLSLVQVSQKESTTTTTTADNRDPSLPRFRLADVRKHDAASGAPWVTSGDRVYDITDWVAAHPGGDVILQAAGHSIDPYWAIFTIHKAPHVAQILESYLIGLVDAADLLDGAEEEAVADPFAADPVRDSRLAVHTQKPCNAEPASPADLTRHFATPNELFYVRNHMWVPVVDEGQAPQHRLTVELPDGDVRAYTLDELRTRFRVHRVPAVLQCSGNRRSDMTRAVAPTNGLQWAAGAISNAVWEGVYLRDVLKDAGLQIDHDDDSDSSPLPPDSLHVQLTGLEAYAASIPLPVAMDPRGDVLLAFGMNGAPLPRDHGFPLRAVVPGHVAARSVKWLSRVVVSDEESTSQWQRRDYKLFGPNEGAQPDWERYPAIQEMPVTSAITRVDVGAGALAEVPAAAISKTPTNSRAPAGTRDLAAWQAAHKATLAQGAPLEMAGYAYSGGGREIVRVDVSIDGGRTWDQAELLDAPTRAYDGDADKATNKRSVVARGRHDWAWKRWVYRGHLDKADADAKLLVKAVDSAYNTQPEHHAGIYNVRGNLATAWHRVRVKTVEGKVVVEGCGFSK